MIPALNLDSFGFAAFDLFVEKVLSLRRNNKIIFGLQILSSSHNLMIQEKCSFKNLKLLNFIPPPYEREPVDAFVANYLRQDCPQAVINLA